MKHPLLARLRPVLASLAAAALLACDGTADVPAVVAPLTWTPAAPAADACNPLAPEWDCLMPYPSGWFLRADATLPRAVRLVLPPAGLPVAQETKQPIDLLQAHPADGFSVLPQIAVRIPGGIDKSNLVFHTGDLAQSLSPDSPTLLVDDQGQPVAHFAEIDPRPAAVDDRVLLLRPLQPLQHGGRYVVALRATGKRGGVRRPDGSAIPLPSGFAALRAGKAQEPKVRDLQPYFDDHVFGLLARAGVPRQELLLAWDFTVASAENATGDMLAVRAQLLTALAQTPPAAKVTKVEENPDEHVGRRIQGELTVPLFLASDKPGAKLHRGADGRPVQNGTAQVPFTVIVPKSLLSGGKPLPARLVQYGHGFFGSQAEVANGVGPEFVAKTGMVMMGVDWWGMSQPDAAIVVSDIITQTHESMRFTDRVHQAMANQIALSVAARTTLLALPELQQGGQPLYDPAHLYFYGNSLGHILGGTYTALAPHVERAVLGVGGAGFAFMMSRAAPFDSFLQIIEGTVGSPAASLRLTLTMQTMLDRIDPVTYAAHVLQPTLADSPKRREVLLQIGLSDTQVPNLAAHIHARALGVSHLQPAPRPVFGLEPATAPHPGSALVEFDFGIPAPDIEAVPVQGSNPVHEGVRRLQAGIAQIDAFLRPDGRIEHTCDGVCDPQ